MDRQSQNYYVFGSSGNGSSRVISDDILRNIADEILGPHRSLDELDFREKELLMLEIEADMLDLTLIPVRDQTIYNR